jgi:hypothetical protein
VWNNEIDANPCGNIHRYSGENVKFKNDPESAE